ncbi:hypothetical protein NDU88_001542 [Pleurodeles waltl]|uniref:Uncharacterized protein n=1 Tax=Pleurodeles waltl TaxID=8319 RepID=A0AAV7SZX7_PLEWA|nr:hypothetical protein NDU88_001542 [Pleurodeles waltl]
MDDAIPWRRGWVQPALRRPWTGGGSVDGGARAEDGGRRIGKPRAYEREVLEKGEATYSNKVTFYPFCFSGKSRIRMREAGTSERGQRAGLLSNARAMKCKIADARIRLATRVRQRKKKRDKRKYQ